LRTAIITGSCNYPSRPNLWALLDDEFDKESFNHLVQGGCKGADAFAKSWAEKRGIRCTTVEADWATHGRRAGPIRNAEMLDMFPAGRLIAFPVGESKGTRGCVKMAMGRGMKTSVHEVKS
jgi:hypothetical protein